MKLKHFPREKLRIVITPTALTMEPMQHGAYNGGVLVPYGHPWFMATCDELTGIKVHGGVTMTRAFSDEWWLVGFDTAQAGDTEENWPLARVVQECELLLIIAQMVVTIDEDLEVI